MPHTRTGRTVGCEIGMALAVLALWMLSLFAPLHQAAGLLREMAKAGHEISGAWSICVTLAQDQDRPDHPPPVCPAQGIGKSEIALPPPPFALADLLPLSHDVVIPQDRAPLVAAQAWLPRQPRAPPART
ncbi:hypothetical protein [Paracoccus sp. S3-43]|uniref:hypothetical protein n=1 Tax=Paracoccus sp. S3-43 TaxID=3030011 RepID=UPI0023AFDFAC|nr:hypothetical protein [Paracoccus sp. S3-43]WEF24849.1 hypothetical protein PXD02_02525 [Paracoccus sp. S3-43]